MEIVPKLVPGWPVVLDNDLAAMIGTLTKRSNEAAPRNHDRFLWDFRLPLSQEEWRFLESQSATSSVHGGQDGNELGFRQDEPN